jgi:hypothetical protein
VAKRIATRCRSPRQFRARDSGACGLSGCGQTDLDRRPAQSWGQSVAPRRWRVHCSAPDSS